MLSGPSENKAIRPTERKSMAVSVPGSAGGEA